MGARRFESIDHPHGRSWAAVYGMALVKPTATCLLPVMVITLVGVLEGVRVVPYALWAAGAALVVAALWTSFQQRRKLAEIRIQDGWAQSLSVRDVARGHRRRSQRVLDVKHYGSWAFVTIGLSSYELERARWPEFEELVAVLRQAREELRPG